MDFSAKASFSTARLYLLKAKDEDDADDDEDDADEDGPSPGGASTLRSPWPLNDGCWGS
jgi:hypothetical protein